MENQCRWLGSVIALLFFGFILWVIYLANTGQSSVFFGLVRQVPYGDKVGHFMLFGLLTLLANWGLRFRKVNLGSIPMLLGTFLVVLFVLVEEISQAWLPSRTLDWRDLLADAAGIGLFHGLSWWLAAKKQKNSQ
ncbi:VanZ family protein [Ferrimonas lipolytica]|uniref:VanZ family protein n=1 Tax=Ferrimonas lipolytica TaxID=2724191 RepID=A0A6H1UII2_9GAMM|nr:VanZ family protein [Ferrimonas lipolytica]